MSESRDPVRNRGADLVRASSEHLGHGLTLAASVALFGWIGWEVGERVGAQPVLTLLGMLLGGVAGFYGMYVRLVVQPRQKRDSQGSERGSEKD